VSARRIAANIAKLPDLLLGFEREKRHVTGNKAKPLVSCVNGFAVTRRFPSWSAEVTPNCFIVTVANRLPAAFALLNLHTDLAQAVFALGDLIPLRNPETSPSTNLLGLFSF
jgi:hypothetical protein